MNDELFAELMESVREGGAILRGQKQPSRQFVIEAPDVKQIREGYDLSQREFAALLGISIKTLQNWEQGRRTPHGAARILLQVAASRCFVTLACRRIAPHPNAVWDVVQPAGVS